MHDEHKCVNEKWIGAVEEWRKSVDADRARFNIHDEEANRDGGNRQQLRDCVKAIEFVRRNIGAIALCSFVCGIAGSLVTLLFVVSTDAGRTAFGYFVRLFR